MHHFFRKSCALLLVLAMLVSLAALTAFAADRAKVPTVYLCGYGSGIVADKTDASSPYVFPAAIPENFASEVMNRVKKPLLKGAMLNQWDDFHREVVDLTLSIYGPMALDKNGEASDGSGHPDYEYTYPLPENRSEDGYGIYDYHFEYDWRLDPFVNAAKLNDYVNGVCEATGFEKVNLIGRCLGANIILAYVQQYGFKKVDQICYYAAGFQGFECIGALFSGEMDFDQDAIPDFFDNAGRSQFVGTESNPTYDLIVVLLEFLNAAKTLKIGELVFDNYLIPEFKQYILPDVMRGSFATFPGFWSFIGDEYYDEAMKVIFSGHEAEYAELIEKANHYHNDVMHKTDELILSGIEQGVETYILSKYGARSVPIVKEATAQSDSTVYTSNSSYGAVTAPLYESFSDEFVRGVMAANGGKHLSPDRQIEASSCLLPDHTWFIKNLYHHDFPDSVDCMMIDLFNFDGYTTIYDLQSYPQFLVYDSETGQIAPMQADEPALQAPKYSFFKKLIALFKAIFNLLKNR